MGALFTLPVDPDPLWERYRALAVQLGDHPALASNRQHMEEMAQAERAWKAAYLARAQ